MFVSPDVLHPQSDYLDSHINLSVEEGEFVECGRFIDAEKVIIADINYTVVNTNF
jgi:hypothetical protein